MKNLSLLVSLLFFELAFSQTTSYVSEIGKIKSFVNLLIQKDDTKSVKYYYRLDSNSPAIGQEEMDSDRLMYQDWEIMYRIYKRNRKIIAIEKAYPGTSSERYDYYFNDDGKIIGASKSISFVSGSNSCSWFVRYYSEYVFNFNSGDWEKDKTDVYNYDNGKEIIINSPKCLNVKKELQGYVSRLESINKYSDLKSFLTGNRINP